MVRLPYEVDEAMMGGDAIITEDEIRRFCSILQDRLDKEGFEIEIRPITDSYNGAKNRTGDYDAHIPEFIWDEAMEEFLNG